MLVFLAMNTQADVGVTDVENEKVVQSLLDIISDLLQIPLLAPEYVISHLFKMEIRT